MADLISKLAPVAIALILAGGDARGEAVAAKKGVIDVRFRTASYRRALFLGILAVGGLYLLPGVLRKTRSAEPVNTVVVPSVAAVDDGNLLSKAAKIPAAVFGFWRAVFEAVTGRGD